MSAREVWTTVKQAASDWSDDNASRLAAALAYYTIFSLAPLLVIAVVVMSFIMRNNGNAKERVVGYFTSVAQGIDPNVIRQIIDNASQHSAGILATIISAAITIWGAFGFFGNIQQSMDTVWEVKPKSDLGLFGTMKKRALKFLLVGAIALLLLGSIAVTTAITAYAKHAGDSAIWGKLLAYCVDIVGSMIVYSALFATVFRFVPDVKVAWRDVWVGGIITGLLFLLGKYALGFYLTHGSAASTFGAAGSLAALLIWIYYSAQIFFFGAEVTQVYARRSGTEIVPDEGAVPLEGAERAKMTMGGKDISRTRAAPRPAPLSREPRPIQITSGTPHWVAASGLALGFAMGAAGWFKARTDPVRRARMDIAKWRLDKLESRLAEVARPTRRAREMDVQHHLADTNERVARVMHELHKQQWKRRP